jgi:hypothetical protein
MIERRWTFSFCLQLVIVELYHFSILHSMKTLTESRNIYIVVDLVCAKLIPALTQHKEKLVLRLLSERRNAFLVDSEWDKFCSGFKASFRTYRGNAKWMSSYIELLQLGFLRRPKSTQNDFGAQWDNNFKLQTPDTCRKWEKNISCIWIFQQLLFSKN